VFELGHYPTGVYFHGSAHRLRHRTLALLAGEIENIAIKREESARTFPTHTRRCVEEKPTIAKMRSHLLKVSRALFGWPPEPSPPAVKQALVARFAAQAPNLVETGTFEGDMIEAQRERYARIVTIEMADVLCATAQKRFAAFPHISVLHGDSGRVLPDAFKLIEGPAVFWLDGHYSGGVTAGDDADPPILHELSMIAQRQQDGDVILIDDARLFGWRRGYPRLSTVRQFVRERLSRHEVRVESDVICIEPVRAP